MKIIVALTLLLVFVNVNAGSEEAGSGVDSNEPILYCVFGSDEAGSGTSSGEDAGTDVSSSDETENTITCVLIN